MSRCCHILNIMCHQIDGWMADIKSPFIHPFIHFPVIWMPIDGFTLDLAPCWFGLCFLEDHFFMLLVEYVVKCISLISKFNSGIRIAMF
jgi:hypothetical protein